VVQLINNVTFYVNKINNHPIGASVLLLAYVSNNPGLNNLTGGSHGAYTDNLCFFRYLAAHRGAPVVNVETSTKTYFHQYLDHTELPLPEFKGLYLDELPVLERLFNINVFVYELKETEEGKVNAELVRRSPYKFDDTMNLNLYMNHFSYIKDLRSYSRSYACRICDKLWKHVGTLHRHENITKEVSVTNIPVGSIIQQRPFLKNWKTRASSFHRDNVTFLIEPHTTLRPCSTLLKKKEQQN
jgi:hypothetical protein